jgi:ADP-heptose:LPS heptosyltransferase
MTIKFMHIVDFWVGVPLCFIVGMWVRFSRLFNTRSPSNNNRTLAIEVSEMGSAVLAYPALRYYAELIGKDNLFFLTFDKHRETLDLLEIMPAKNIITISDDSFLSFTLSSVKALLRVRKLGLEAVIDLELFSRFTALFSGLSGARLMVGFHNYEAEGLYRGEMLTHPVLYNTHIHIGSNFFNLFYATQESEPPNYPLLKRRVQRELPPPVFKSDENCTQLLSDKLASLGHLTKPDSKLILVNPDPGEFLSIRGWPVENYVSLIDKLSNKFEYSSFLVIGLKESKPYANEILKSVNSSSRVIDFTGETGNIRELLSLIAMSDLLISTDGGTAHLASFTNTRSLVLFGPETPELYAPLGNNATCLTANFTCSPCLSAANHRKVYCKDNLCMKDITVEKVFSHALNILANE